MYENKCIQCNNVFPSLRPQYKLCSPECRLAYKAVYNKMYIYAYRSVIRKQVTKRHIEDPTKRQARNAQGGFSLYKTTEQWYLSKLQEQGNVCALCFRENGKRRLHIDHDHKCCGTRGGKNACGKCNRGLLCVLCNQRLAHVERVITELEEPMKPAQGTWLFRAFNYIKDYDIVRTSKQLEEAS